jgi:hypothetical protein
MIANDASRVVSKAVFPLTMLLRLKCRRQRHVALTIGHLGLRDIDRMISVGQGREY